MLNKFNVPLSGQIDHTISNFILACFEACENGSAVEGSFMFWEGDEFTAKLDEIISAKHLKFSMRCGSDNTDSNFSPFVLSFFRKYECKANHETVAKRKNHSKYLLFHSISFAKLDPVQTYSGPAILISSGNIGEESKHNTADLVPISVHQKQTMSRYHNLLIVSKARTALTANQLTMSINTLNGEKHTSLLLYPRTLRADQQIHPYVNLLKNIKGGGILSIVTPRIHNSRFLEALQSALIRNPGLHVVIISRSCFGPKNQKTGKSKLEVELPTRKTLNGARCTLILHNNSRKIHSKYLLFSGKYEHPGDRAKSTKVLWTGSMNVTNAGHHWEQVLKTTNSETFSAYEDNFATILGMLIKDEFSSNPNMGHKVLKELFPLLRVT